MVEMHSGHVQNTLAASPSTEQEEGRPGRAPQNRGPGRRGCTSPHPDSLAICGGGASLAERAQGQREHTCEGHPLHSLGDTLCAP